MKRLCLILLYTILGVLTAVAQHIEVGSHAPHIKNVEWISDRPELMGGRFLMVEFFHSAAEDSRAHIEPCNALAHDYRKQMDVVVLTREPAEQVAGMLLHEYQYFYVASDESGETYRAFGVSHVPYAVIVNPKGVIVWAGNPIKLSTTTIEKLLQQ
ncbi:MAG: redoxin domain-containing protein [Tidjanibacter sp.]|nr:redoxin domain-containing protein [Tidjanibacter sp.]